MAKPNRPRGNRFEHLSDDEIQARWRALKPMFIKWLIICALAAPCLFFANRLWPPGPQMANILAVAFRIAVGGAGLFAFLLVMALIFSRPKRDQ
jgi:hypothetical protein